MMDLVAASTRGFSSKRPLPRVLFLGRGVGKLGVLKTEAADQSLVWSGHFGNPFWGWVKL